VSVVELLYAANVISRKRGVARQALEFYLLVENIAYAKTVEVHWVGEGGGWEILPAAYVAAAGNNRELWRAQTWRQGSAAVSLPGNVQFAVVCRSGAQEHWSNRGGRNYRIEADAGLILGESTSLVHIGYTPLLQIDQKSLTVEVATPAALDVEQVFVEWSTDGWQTKNRTPCVAVRDHWDKNQQSNARNPNQYGVQIWTGRPRIRDAFRVEYVVGCVTRTGELWDNNRGANYVARRADLKVLTLNLHCYQEDHQDYKLSLIARAINELDIDIVCLQEVAENWNNGAGDWNSNAAKIIAERLDRPYHLHADWSHRGFDRYREGVAILSKFPLLKHEARYVSRSHDIHSIHSRKVVMVQVEAPYMGLVNVFSAHLSWWEDGFREQFETLAGWAQRRHTKHVVATLVGGDFNIKAGSAGYSHVVTNSDLEDQHLNACCRPVFDAIYRQREPHWEQRLQGDHRIDYIFMRRNSTLKPTATRTLFTENDYGRVSDHVGFMVAFEPL
jgi:maltose 6'-phosphate phosphatase